MSKDASESPPSNECRFTRKRHVLDFVHVTVSLPLPDSLSTARPLLEP
jgi:hypothetical protein